GVASGTQSHITQPSRSLNSSARWPIAKDGSRPMPTTPRSSRQTSLCEPANCSRVSQRWPFQFTYCRSSSQIRQARGGSRVSGNWAPHCSQVHRGMTTPKLLLASQLADHVVVIGRLADLVPLILLEAERHHGVVQLLDPLVLGADLGIELAGGLEGGIENLGRERPQLRAVGDQPLDRPCVVGIVFGGEVG